MKKSNLYISISASIYFKAVFLLKDLPDAITIELIKMLRKKPMFYIAINGKKTKEIKFEKMLDRLNARRIKEVDSKTISNGST